MASIYEGSSAKVQDGFYDITCSSNDSGVGTNDNDDNADRCYIDNPTSIGYRRLRSHSGSSQEDDADSIEYPENVQQRQCSESFSGHFGQSHDESVDAESSGSSSSFSYMHDRSGKIDSNSRSKWVRIARDQGSR